MTRLVAILVLVALGAASLFGIQAYRRAYRTPPVAPPREEITVTIIPGWNLRNVAEKLVELDIASSTKDVYALTGTPGKDQDSLEGYLAPETVRFFKEVELKKVIDTFRDLREKQLTPELQAETKKKNLTVHELLTMASIIEKETKNDADRYLVSDILWRRVNRQWALQVDSSVHYAVDRTGDVYTTEEERKIDSPWNTYQYPGLPPGPIALPSVESIMAALRPGKNSYWYFLSGADGKMHYAETLEEHNINRVKYLR